MKLFNFPAAVLEKAINKRLLTLPSAHKDWFASRWRQKPYRKAFIDNKAMPLVIFLAKGKSWSDEEFATELQAWDVHFYPAEVEVLRPIVEGDGMLQLMQKKVQPERIQALHAKLAQLHFAGSASPGSSPDA